MRHAIVVTRRVVPYWLDLETPHVGLFVLLSMTPVLCHALAHGWMLSRLTRRDTVSGGAGNVVLITLGMTTFAVLVALGFIVHWSPDRGWAVRHLAAPVALLGLPLAAGGTLLWRRLSCDEVAACYTFGSPKVGNEEFGDAIKVPVYRIVNAADSVPSLPPTWFWEILIGLAWALPIPYVRRAVLAIHTQHGHARVIRPFLVRADHHLAVRPPLPPVPPDPSVSFAPARPRRLQPLRRRPYGSHHPPEEQVIVGRIALA